MLRHNECFLRDAGVNYVIGNVFSMVVMHKKPTRAGLPYSGITMVVT